MVARALGALGMESTLVTFTTVGDRRLDEPLSAIGSKGLFTMELEASLLSGQIDLAVHSLKDLPTESPEGLIVGAVLTREDPRDALIVRGRVGDSLEDLPPGAKVGTSSLRRRAQLLARRPDLEVVELRGNVLTRLNKSEDGRVDAAILAAAGLHRLDVQQRITSYLDAPAWLPAAGQGAIAVQTRTSDDRMCALVDSVNDVPTMCAVRAERAFLAALDGGCQVPIGALVMEEAGFPILHGMISDVHGTRVVRGTIIVDPNYPESSGMRLAHQLRGEGASKILEGLRRVTPVS